MEAYAVVFKFPCLQESACQIVKSIGENVVLQKVASEGLSFIKKKRSSKKQGAVSKCNNSKENSLDHDMNVNGEF